MTWDGKPIDWGSLNMWAELLTAIGTVAAVVAAVGIAWSASRRASNAEEAARNAEELAEAGLVAVAVHHLRGFEVSNNSAHPIRDVRVYAMTPGNDAFTTPTEATVADGRTVRLVPRPPMGRLDATAAANHAAVYRNRAGRVWATFASGHVEQLPAKEDAAVARVAELLDSTMAAYQERAQGA